ncbi:MAG: penicillin-binding protein 2 [Chloroflexi bacterium]|nr:penicillin-binding protein 2 [Chloroflexota bacterium]
MAIGGRRWRSQRRRKESSPAKGLRRRLNLFRAAAFLFVLIFLAQLGRMQISEGKHYQQQAELNRRRAILVPAERGVIYDRNGQLLVRNVPSFTAAIVSADLPNDKQAEVISKLERLLGVSGASVQEKIVEGRSRQPLYAPIPIQKGLDRETALILKEHQAELEGVVLLTESTRLYEEGSTFAQLLGYVGPISPEEYENLKGEGYDLNDKLGKTGLELTFEKELRGRPGVEEIEVDASGRKRETLSFQSPQPGQSLTLTIDGELQRKMTQYLAEGMGASQNAAAIAMDPRTGEVLGMVSLPSYNNNIFATIPDSQKLDSLVNDPRHPLLNHAIAGVYPPGSTFKIVTGTAALQEGVATPRTQITSTGQIVLRSQYDPQVQYVFRDWAALGSLDFYRAVAFSSDVYFYYLAGGYENFQGLGAGRLAQYARDFGFGQRTGIELPSEAEGLVPDPEWKWDNLKEPWLTGDTYHFGIGQGYVLATPLQMVNLVATVANGGSLFQPKLVRSITDSEGNVIKSFDSRLIRQVRVSNSYLAIMREGMRQAVELGTATTAKVPGMKVAGKTGTAESSVLGPDGKPITHGWFVGFAPYDDPQIAVVVFLERGNGAENAAPIAAKIMNYFFHRQDPPNPATKSGG